MCSDVFAILAGETKGKLFNLPAAGEQKLSARPRWRFLLSFPIPFRFVESPFEREGNRQTIRRFTYGRCFFESFTVAKNRGASAAEKVAGAEKDLANLWPF